MDRDQFDKLLMRACEKAGSQGAFAKEAGLSAAYVSDVLAGRRDPGAKMLAALEVERVVVYQKVKR